MVVTVVLVINFTLDQQAIQVIFELCFFLKKINNNLCFKNSHVDKQFVFVWTTQILWCLWRFLPFLYFYCWLLRLCFCLNRSRTFELDIGTRSVVNMFNIVANGSVLRQHSIDVRKQRQMRVWRRHWLLRCARALAFETVGRHESTVGASADRLAYFCAYASTDARTNARADTKV